MRDDVAEVIDTITSGAALEDVIVAIIGVIRARVPAAAVAVRIGALDVVDDGGRATASVSVRRLLDGQPAPECGRACHFAEVRGRQQVLLA